MIDARTNLGAKIFRKRVDAAYAHAVQAAGDLIAPAAELAARMEHGQGDGQGVFAGLCVIADGNAAAVVAHGDRSVPQERDLDVRTVARERFVDGVIDDLAHKVMQAARIGRADVHARAAPNGFQPFEHLDLRGVIVLRLLFHCHSLFLRFRIRRGAGGSLSFPWRAAVCRSSFVLSVLEDRQGRAFADPVVVQLALPSPFEC